MGLDQCFQTPLPWRSPAGSGFYLENEKYWCWSKSLVLGAPLMQSLHTLMGNAKHDYKYIQESVCSKRFPVSLQQS